MKPFDLEAAKRGEPIVTRDGRKARFVAHVPEADETCRVVAMIEGAGCPTVFMESGKYSKSSELPIDLFMAEPEKKKRVLYQWVMQDKSGNAPLLPQYFYETEEEARAHHPSLRVIQRADWTRIEVEE